MIIFIPAGRSEFSDCKHNYLDLKARLATADKKRDITTNPPRA